MDEVHRAPIYHAFMNLPRSIGGWLLLFTPAALIILGAVVGTLLQSTGVRITGAQAYGFEYALLALLISPILSLCLGVWIARADKGWPIRALYGLGAGVVILLVNLGVGFGGCVSLSQMGFLK
jgi:hypothetical protein